MLDDEALAAFLSSRESVLVPGDVVFLQLKHNTRKQFYRPAGAPARHDGPCGGGDCGGSGGSSGGTGGGSGGGGGVLGKVTKRKRGIWTGEDGHEHKRRLAPLVLDEKATMFARRPTRVSAPLGKHEHRGACGC
jgi:hypothetical protein